MKAVARDGVKSRRHSGVNRRFRDAVG